MGRLRDFSRHLDGRREALGRAEAGLLTLQEKFETFFAEVTRVREVELGQLIELTLADRSSLPTWYNAAVDEASAAVAKQMEAEEARLAAEMNELRTKAEEIRSVSARKEQMIRGRNARLDREEEELKDRNAALLTSIADYNGKIKALGTGFGFFSSFFKMRRLAVTKAELDREHGDVAARIEALRARWVNEERDFVSREEDLSAQWTELEKRIAAISARLEALDAKRPAILVRSTIEKVLEGRRPTQEDPGADAVTCSRCQMRNSPAQHFCSICAYRLGEDRQDFDGSLEEIAEINRHHERFSEGMEACQEIIGLVRGMKSGVEAFAESVAEVQASEDKYPLPKLEIDVPRTSLEIGAQFDRLADFAGQDYSQHPKVFADRFDEYFAQHFTEAKIQEFFETMGEELSRQAGAQWD